MLFCKEEATVTTFGVKNLDVDRELANTRIPRALFAEVPRKPREYQDICAKYCPILSDRLAVVATRKIYRQSPYASNNRIFLL